MEQLRRALKKEVKVLYSKMLPPISCLHTRPMRENTAWLMRTHRHSISLVCHCLPASPLMCHSFSYPGWGARIATTPGRLKKISPINAILDHCSIWGHRLGHGVELLNKEDRETDRTEGNRPHSITRTQGPGYSPSRSWCSPQPFRGTRSKPCHPFRRSQRSWVLEKNKKPLHNNSLGRKSCSSNKK